MANFLITYSRYKHPATKLKFYQVGISEAHRSYKWLRHRFDTATQAMDYGSKLVARLERARAAKPLF